MVFLNTLGRPQRTEITLYDEGSQSPPFVHDVPAGRSTKTYLQDKIPWLGNEWRALSATVRWEKGGHVHWVTWRVPFVFSDPIAWLFQWRMEMVSPATEHVVCEVP